MKINSLVSIIIPCYNYARFISETLQCVLDQSYTNWECIIINDGSIDNTEEIVLQWTKKDQRFIYFSKENSGVSDTRNLGIRNSKGIYILPLDADDKISKTYIEEAVQILDSKNEITVVYSEAEFFGAQKGKWKLPDFSYDELLSRNIVFCSAIFRKEMFDKTPGYNTNMHAGLEDWDFWLTFMEHGATFYKLPKIHFYYRINENSRNKSINDDNLQSLYKQIYLNHFDLYMSNLEAPQEIFCKLRGIQRSKEYHLGKFFLYPIRKLLKLLNKRQWVI